MKSFFFSKTNQFRFSRKLVELNFAKREKKNVYLVFSYEYNERDL